MDTGRQITCRYCHAVIEYGGRGAGVRGSAWIAPGQDNPGQCVPSAPGHAPDDDQPQRTDRPGY